MSSHPYKIPNQTASKLKNYTTSVAEPFSQKNSVQKGSRIYNDYPHNPNSRENSPQYENEQQLKAETVKLKKMLKQAQAKRIQITKECSELANKYEKLEQENMHLHRKIKEFKDVGEGEKFRYQELKFLNKELSVQIQQLQRQNEILNDKLKHHADILQKKYEEIEERAYKRIEQALKRIKKAIHYLSSLSTKQIQKTKDIQIENLTKAAQVLKGKYTENNKFEEQIQELMNPIRNIQEELHQKIKQASLLKEQNVRLNSQVKKHKKIEKELLPQYKQAIEKLKKNLGQVRMQLSENQYDKLQVKKKYEQKIKEVQIKYEELFKQHRKLKLENKIFQKKMEQMEDDVEEEKQRLMGENQLLKKLYKSQDQKSRRSVQKELGLDGYLGDNGQQERERDHQTEAFSYKTTNQFRKPVKQLIKMGRQIQNGEELKKTYEKDHKSSNYLKKNYSASQLRNEIQRQSGEARKKQRAPLRIKQGPSAHKQVSESRNSNRSRKNYDHLRHGQQKRNQTTDKRFQHIEDYQMSENQTPDGSQLNFEYQEGQSEISASQDGLKNEIFKIDQQIMEIQKTLDRQLNMFS